MGERISFRACEVEDSHWMAEAVNTPDVARYLVTVYPLTEHEVKQQLKEAVKSEHEKHIVAELDGEPVGYVGLHLGRGRTRHVGWLGLWVRRNFWGRKIGTALMEELIRIAKAYGCRKLMLEVFEGNGKALKLLGKWGLSWSQKRLNSLILRESGTLGSQWD